MGVRFYDFLAAQQFLAGDGLSDKGAQFLSAFGVDIAVLSLRKRPLCRSCLDWSARRTHLAGSVGAAVLDCFYTRGWAHRVDGTRVVLFSSEGERRFNAAFKAL